MAIVLGKCPNCGAKMENKSTLGLIEYKTGRGVIICEACISNPERLNETIIANNLLERGWFLPDIELVRNAIRIRKLAEK